MLSLKMAKHRTKHVGNNTTKAKGVKQSSTAHSLHVVLLITSYNKLIKLVVQQNRQLGTGEYWPDAFPVPSGLEKADLSVSLN
jgi:hypothetical protein